MRMNMENIAGAAATGVLVFLGVVVAPRMSDWDATTSSVAALAAVIVAAAGAALLVRLLPADVSARQFEVDAAWDQALADLMGHDVA